MNAQYQHSIPWYLDSSFSSFRNFVRTSIGSSLAFDDVSAAFSGLITLPSAPSAAALVSAMLTAFSSIGGVPAPEGFSDSSSMTKAFSNSEGSVPLAGASPLSFAFGRLSLEAGDSPVLEIDRRMVVEGDLETGAAAF